MSQQYKITKFVFIISKYKRQHLSAEIYSYNIWYLVLTI